MHIPTQNKKSHTHCSHTVLTCGHLFFVTARTFHLHVALKNKSHTDAITHAYTSRAGALVCVCVQACAHLFFPYMHVHVQWWGRLQCSQSCRTEAQPAHFLYGLPFPRAAATTGEPNSPPHHRSHYIFTMPLHHMSPEAFKCIMQLERELWDSESWFCLTFVLRHLQLAKRMRLNRSWCNQRRHRCPSNTNAYTNAHT